MSEQATAGMAYARLAEIAYQAWWMKQSSVRGFLAVDWKGLPEIDKHAWEAAVRTVCDAKDEGMIRNPMFWINWKPPA